MWVQLKSVQHIEVRGVTKKYHPGDWVDVGKQTAQLWLGRGDAIIPIELPATFKTFGAGAVVLSGEAHARKQLEPYTGLEVMASDFPCLLWEKTIVWEAAELPHVTPIRFGAGIGLLDTWEIAAPLCNYKTLAAHVGTDEEREKTQRVILDLRVPLYETRLMFIRRTPDTERLLSLWREETGDRRLAFMRVLWKIKPFILALPAHWIGGEYAG